MRRLARKLIKILFFIFFGHIYLPLTGRLSSFVVLVRESIMVSGQREKEGGERENNEREQEAQEDGSESC